MVVQVGRAFHFRETRGEVVNLRLLLVFFNRIVCVCEEAEGFALLFSLDLRHKEL